MITYDRSDQSAYYAERSAYICVLAGLEPVLITPENLRNIKIGLTLTLTGSDLVKAKYEASNIAMFAGTLGFEE
jgi:hypothetical protein